MLGKIREKPAGIPGQVIPDTCEKCQSVRRPAFLFLTTAKIPPLSMTQRDQIVPLRPMLITTGGSWLGQLPFR